MHEDKGKVRKINENLNGSGEESVLLPTADLTPLLGPPYSAPGALLAAIPHDGGTRRLMQLR
jgi:hypothetical protein